MAGNRLNSTIEESENERILFILNKNWGVVEWEKTKENLWVNFLVRPDLNTDCAD